MNPFKKYGLAHDLVYNQLLEADTKATITYWSEHYNKLWMMCYWAQPESSRK